jgi:hypothetical protein
VFEGKCQEILKVQKQLDATFGPILKMNVGQVFKILLNFLKVAGEGCFGKPSLCFRGFILTVQIKVQQKRDKYKQYELMLGLYLSVEGQCKEIHHNTCMYFGETVCSKRASDSWQK